jgi:hypothetical protein
MYRFYVYALGDLDDPDYIGKGSSNRLKVSARERGVQGVELARFKREKDAYAFEREKIAELAPTMNRARGGNGSRAARVYRRKSEWEREMDRCGTRLIAASILAQKGILLTPFGTLDYTGLLTEASNS